jgi:hypothetical protein
MAKQLAQIEPAHTSFIRNLHVFFTASAAAAGRVNVSPRNAVAFRVLDPNTVTYLDETVSRDAIDGFPTGGLTSGEARTNTPAMPT